MGSHQALAVRLRAAATLVQHGLPIHVDELTTELRAYDASKRPNHTGRIPDELLAVILSHVIGKKDKGEYGVRETFRIRPAAAALVGRRFDAVLDHLVPDLRSLMFDLHVHTERAADACLRLHAPFGSKAWWNIAYRVTLWSGVSKNLVFVDESRRSNESLAFRASLLCAIRRESGDDPPVCVSTHACVPCVRCRLCPFESAYVHSIQLRTVRRPIHWICAKPIDKIFL
jgi:hypothetical protein